MGTDVVVTGVLFGAPSFWALLVCCHRVFPSCSTTCHPLKVLPGLLLSLLLFSLVSQSHHSRWSGLGVSVGVWNDSGSHQLFTALRRRRKEEDTNLYSNGVRYCVTVRQTCTVTGSTVLLGFRCLGPRLASSGARTRSLRPTHALLLLGPPSVLVRSGPLLSTRGVYRQCTSPASPGAGTPQPRLLDTTLHHRLWDWGLPGSGPLRLSDGFAGDCFCLRLWSKHEESALPTLDATGHCLSASAGSSCSSLHVVPQTPRLGLCAASSQGRLTSSGQVLGLADTEGGAWLFTGSEKCRSLNGK